MAQTEMIARAALIALAILSGHGRVAAQSLVLTQSLQDGRTIIVAPATAVCGHPLPYNDARFALSLRFDCRDTVSGVEGSVFLGAAARPGETTPSEYLAGIAEDYWPALTPAQRLGQMITGDAELASGKAELICIAVSDREQTVAHGACVLDQPKTQVIVHMRSSSIRDAYGVMILALSGVSIR
jgi:hypothetical protein